MPLDIKTYLTGQKGTQSKSKSLTPNKPLEDKPFSSNLTTDINLSDRSDVGASLLKFIVQENVASGNSRGPLEVATGPLKNMKSSVEMIPMDPRTGQPRGSRDDSKSSTHTQTPERHNRNNTRTPTKTRYGTEVTREVSPGIENKDTVMLGYGVAVACLHILTGRSRVSFPHAGHSGPSPFVHVSLSTNSGVDPAHQAIFPIRIPWDKWEYGITPVLLAPDLPKKIYKGMLHRGNLDEIIKDLHGRLALSYREQGWAI